MIVDRDLPQDAIDDDPPPVDVDLPTFAEVSRPNQPCGIHLAVKVSPAALPEQEVMPPDLRRDSLNDVHGDSVLRRIAR